METHKLQQALESELALVTEELNGVATFDKETGDWQATPAGPADEADPNDAADAAEDSIERQALVANLETRYRNINRGLAKINDGVFGACELCKSKIEDARLEANPAARTCIADREREGELTL